MTQVPTSFINATLGPALHLLQRASRPVTYSRALSTMADSSNLIERLHALAKKSPKLVKPHYYNAPADNTIRVSSWKMNEFKYYDVPSPFPTLARGLFTTDDVDNTEDTDVKYRIVARGYDKFFNIGETPWTNVRRVLCEAG